MKPEELLNSLSHVGEDLLAGAEQTILVRKRRPWLGTAVAASLLVALGVGGFLLLKKHLSPRDPVPGTDGPSVTEPSLRPEDPYRNLSALTVGDCWTGLSRVRFDDLERSAAGTLASDYLNLSSLPVYLPEGSLNGGAKRDPEEYLVQRLQKAADWLGATLSDAVGLGYAEGSSLPESCSADTDQGTLTVWIDGRISMLYDEAHAITSHAKASLAGGLTQEETQRALRDLCMEDCGAQLAERLGLGECGFVTCDRWDPTSSAWTVFTIYPLREDPAQQLVSRWFESVRLLTNDGRTLRGFELDRFPREDLTEPPEGLWLQGSYPVIAPGEATNGLDLGSFLCEEESIDRVSVYSNALCEQLVYLPEAGHELLMPFYRFWVAAGEAGERGEYIAVYVPAVRDEYLTDWELYRSSRLATLSVGEVARGEPALLLTDREAYLASNPWKEEERINALPVYELPETGALEGSLYLFDEDKRCTPECGAGFTGGERSEGLIRAFADRVIRAAGLNSGLFWGVVEGEYPQAQTVPGADQPLYAAEIFLVTNGTAAGRVENYSLARVKLWYRDGVLWGFTLPAYTQPYVQFLEPVYVGIPVGVEDPDSFRTEPPETELPIGEIGNYTQAGLYPIISPAEARELAWAGKFAGAAAERPAGGLALLPTYFTGPEELMMDLVYLPNGDGTCLMPFYRFLYPIGGNTETGAEVCEARYIPAVTGLYLADYPPEPEEPAATEPPEPTETQFTEPTDDVPEPTELPDETQPDRPGGLSVPTVVELPDGTPGIQGPAGTVKALLYLGDCEDPVWADLNRDGRKELIYWCHGPTSGLFTIGLCVYGLEQGWPVLKDGVLYNLDWGQLRLTEEDGQIFLHYERSQWDPATQTHVAQPEQALSVTLEDGKLVLNGGKAPEGCELWGSSDLTRFGRSFSALEQEVKDSCFIKHWACLVWAEPSYGSTDTQQNLCAAASTNGVTVTGYLRWLPQPNGTVHCFAQGLEAIEAPEDPAALSGLTMEQLEARFGPCHFDMGSGMYIPCWFTTDCRMLVVHMGGAANSAELRDLATAGN